jgi:hypothetical protein
MRIAQAHILAYRPVMGPARVPATESLGARLIRYVHLLEEEEYQLEKPSC